MGRAGPGLAWAAGPRDLQQGGAWQAAGQSPCRWPQAELALAWHGQVSVLTPYWEREPPSAAAWHLGGCSPKQGLSGILWAKAPPLWLLTAGNEGWTELRLCGTRVGTGIEALVSSPTPDPQIPIESPRGWGGGGLCSTRSRGTQQPEAHRPMRQVWAGRDACSLDPLISVRAAARAWLGCPADSVPA